MKKILLSALAVSALLSASAQTVRKVILEDFTGTWCGWCPEGTLILEGLKTQYPTTFYPVASHNADPLQVPEGAAIDNGLAVTAYPNGAIDRFKFSGASKISMSRGQWVARTGQRFNMPAIVSVSLSNLMTDGTNYSGTINAQFSAAPNGTMPINMQLYILEDSIPATGSLAQSNYSPNIQGGADPLVNWYHNETLRKGLGGNWGWSGEIPNAAVVGTTYKKDFTFTVPSTWKKKNIHVLAFVAYNGDTSVNGKEILNADGAYLSSFWPAAISDVQDDLQTSIYPNPANVNSTINYTFNLNSAATVKFEVYDVTGKLVSTPYESYEIAGIHTVRWIPAANPSVGSGVYFAHITASNGQSGVYKFQVQ